MMNRNSKDNDILYTVVHPLDDLPEQKRSVDDLGRMPMTRSVRFTLNALRGYLILMGALIAYQALAFAHIVR